MDECASTETFTPSALLFFEKDSERHLWTSCGFQSQLKRLCVQSRMPLCLPQVQDSGEPQVWENNLERVDGFISSSFCI